MMSDTSKILNVFVAFCRENLDILMVGGVILLALIIAVSFLRNSKKNGDEDLDFYEELKIKDTKKDIKEDEIPKANEPKPRAEEKDGKNEIDNLVSEAFDDFIESSFSDAFRNILEEIDEEYERNHMVALEEESEENSEDESEEPQEESMADEEALQEPVVLDEPLEESTEVSVDDDVETFEETEGEELELKEPELKESEKEESCFEKTISTGSNNVSKNTSCIEYIVEGLATLSGDGVKEVGIKIPGAEVKITYCKEDAETEKVSNDQEIDEMKAEADVSGDEVDNAIAKDDETEIQPKPRKKFGPDNMNVSRSGKVYSEEELELQIRD